MKHSFYRRYGKRCLDVVGAGCALVLLLPILTATSLLVRTRLGHPSLFIQQRPGRGGKLFSLLKFRTMIDARDHEGQLLPDAVRLTPFGKFLRSTSLDELPELWNVLRGDMSFVGPRPWLPQYLALYTEQQARRHEVRPGITGWAQVNGRNRTDWPDRLAMDVWYVDNCSFWLDLRILVLTLVTVLRRSDVSADGHATMPAFMGTQSAAPVAEPTKGIDHEASRAA